MKISRLILTFVLMSVAALIMQCQHNDGEVIPVKGPDPIERGTEKVNCTDCTPLQANGASADFNAGAVPVGTWYFDKSHSNVLWETKYKSMGSLLTGRFNYFVLKNLVMDEATPTAIAFEGYVRLNSVNTGEPGRDGNCLLTTYGTAAGKTTEAENIATIVSKPGTGRYSTSDEGFYVDADFTFMGVTNTLPIKLTYFKQTDQGTFTMSGVTGEFVIDAYNHFGKADSNIDKNVKITVNCLMRNKK